MSEDPPELSVVISTKNRPGSLERTLASVRRQTCRNQLEVIVVDDGSSPAVEDRGPDVRLFRNPESLGMCGARNRGWREARGRYAVYLDDDAEFATNDALERAVARARSVDRCAVVAFRQLRPDGSTHYMQPAVSEVACLTNRFYGYGFLFDRALLSELDGFRDPFGYYMEEIEISLRVLDRGYRIVYEPGTTVVHHEDPRGRDLKRIGRMRLRNALLVVLLTYPAWAIVPGCLRSIQNVLRHAPGLDLSGRVAAVRDVFDLISYVQSHRDAVKTGTLLEYTSLGRRPRAL